MSRLTINEANCIVPGCSSSKKIHPHMEFYQIPPNKDEEWLTMINRQELLEKVRASYKSRSKYRICSLHFDDSMILLRRSLIANATPAFNIPEKNDVENVFFTDKIVQTDENNSFEKSRLWELNNATFIYPEPSKVTEKSSIHTQTEHVEMSHAETECFSKVHFKRKRSIKKKVQKANPKFICKAKNQVPPSSSFEKTLRQLCAWLKNIKTEIKDKNLFKIFALILYFDCTPLYENIQKSLNLPQVSTLLKWTINISCLLDRPTVNVLLSHKLKWMGEKSKYCILFFNAIHIKPHVYYNITKDKFVGLQQNKQKYLGDSKVKATTALFMMLRGIQDDWQQLINCFLINEQRGHLELDSVEGTLKILEDIGFQVKTIVMDPNPYMYKYAKEVLKVTSENPSVMLKSKEVYVMFEPRDLILEIRNIFLDNDLYSNNAEISWNYVKELYLHKEKYNLSILPKLTRDHVFPDELQRTDYKYASEIFSDEVSSTLEFYISLSLISRDALQTARFIRSISFLIDIFSSNSVNHENELKSAFKMNKQQCSVLLYVQDLFKTLSVISKSHENIITNNIFDCVLITIHSLLLLNNTLKDVEISHFMTKRFHRIPVDKVKKKINNAFKGKVTAVKLLKILGNHFIRQLIRDKKFYHIPNNLKELLMRGKSIVASINQLEKNLIYHSRPNAISCKTKSLNGDFDYQFRLPERRKITYLSAYLFYKCYKQHRCCFIEIEWKKMEFEWSSNDIPWNDCLPLTLKENLRKPSPAFQQIVFHLEQAFLKNFFRAKNKPVEDLMTALKVVTDKYKPICECFPIDYFLLLFIRHRIYSVLMYNRELSKQRQSNNLILNSIIN